MLNRFVKGGTRRHKQLMMVAFDAVAAAASVWVAVALRMGSLTWGSTRATWLMAVAALLVIPPCFQWFGLYREITRYIGTRFALQLAKGVFAATAVLVVLMWVFPERLEGFPRSAVVISGMLILLTCSGARLVARAMIRSATTVTRRVAIYGAGDAGAGLAGVLGQDRATLLVAMLDDNPALVGGSLRSIPVMHTSELDGLVTGRRIDTLLVALGSQARRLKSAELQRARAAGIHVLTVPTLDEIGHGMVKIDQLRPLAITDLLGRPPVKPISALLEKCVRGQTVLVTGAGGSIGSELCRQILRLGPVKLVIVDNCEFALFQVENELRRALGQLAPGSAPVGFASHLGSVTDAVRMEGIISQHQPETIYHAAAYKHVPIVEENEIEGLEVNVLGTDRVSECAFKYGVRNLIFISTDKAVRPTSVMGASKRLAEIVLQARQAAEGSSRTRVSMVRFGNVLGSSGSVVPLFESQIRAGGPVTVTHPEVTRYFMTIPEAVALVLQAGSLGTGGEVFVLDMGEPVKILDLARTMISLSGRTARRVDEDGIGDGSIEIVFTGMRPGEKIFEELIIGENVVRTEHPSVMRAHESHPNWSDVEGILQLLEATVAQHNRLEARRLLSRWVEGYQGVAQGSAVAEGRRVRS